MTAAPESTRDVVFVHRVRDADEQYDSDPDDPFERDVVPPARIRMNVEEGGDFWLSANREGYLHLARVFAEMGIRPLEDGYHFHMNSEFQGRDSGPMFSFEVDNSTDDGEALS